MSDICTISATDIEKIISHLCNFMKIHEFLQTKHAATTLDVPFCIFFPFTAKLYDACQVHAN